MDTKLLDRYLDSLLDFGLPMYDLTVHVRYEEVYRRQGGFIDVARRRTHEPDTKYFLYSCSKPVTTAAALTLLETGKYRLSDPLCEYMPEFAEMQVADRAADGTVTLRPAKTKITVRDLFTMTAGFSYNLNAPAIKAAVAENPHAPTREIARAIAREPLTFDPGDRWQYSLCHDVLAAFTEVVAGRRFADYVRETVFLPLGMENTGYHIANTSEMAAQYQYNDATHAVYEVPLTNSYVPGDQYDSGGAGMISTAEDYIRFADAMANGGVGQNGARILAADTVELWRKSALTPHQARTFNWSQFAGCTYGLGVQTLADRSAAGSCAPEGVFGWNGAAGAMAMMCPERGVAIFYAQHTRLNHEEIHFPALRNAVFAALGR